MKIDFELSLLDTLIEEGYISKRKHPVEDIYIYNYTAKTQYERLWKDITIACRGLILDKDYNIIARPFSKFFNYGETNESSKTTSFINNPIKITEKLDGSLGILYWIKDNPFIATRGSFESDQAVIATKILYQDYSHLFNLLNRDKTYLFEIIYPENRIVVNYGEIKDIILLTIIDNETGLDDFNATNPGFSQVEEIPFTGKISELTSLNLSNKEGFVVCYDNSFRVKIKFNEYVRLHYLITQVSNKDIWESLSNGSSIVKDLQNCPDEVFSWIKGIEEELNLSFDKIEKEALLYYEGVKHLNRKEIALQIKKDSTDSMFNAILFSIVSGKEYSKLIYKMLKPKERLVYKFTEA